MLDEPAILAITDRFRQLCLAHDGASEKLSHGEPTFFVAGRQFANMDTYHHKSPKLAAWIAAPPGALETLVAADPSRFFRPPYVGHRGWLGIVLEDDPDWDEVAAHVADAVAHIRVRSSSRRSR